jgi:hypothetical protein
MPGAIVAADMVTLEDGWVAQGNEFEWAKKVEKLSDL